MPISAKMMKRGQGGYDSHVYVCVCVCVCVSETAVPILKALVICHMHTYIHANPAKACVYVHSTRTESSSRQGCMQAVLHA